MNCIQINTSDLLKKYPQIGYGGTASVHSLGNGKVLKRFCFVKDGLEKTKEEYLKEFQIKTILLSDMEVEQAATPIEMVFNENGIFEGYTAIEVLTDDSNSKDLWKIANDSLMNKIYYLKKLESVLKKIDEYCERKNKIIVYTDYRYDNFMIDKSDNLWIVDFDLSYVHPFNETYRTTWMNYYRNYISNDITLDANKVNFAFYVLNLLKIKLDEFPNEGVISPSFVRKYINNLIIPQEVNDYFLSLFLSKDSKEYIGDKLDLLTDSSESYLLSKLPMI